MCAGQGCTVELTNVTLTQTALVVTAGATVALSRCQLSASHTSGHGICILAAGARTIVKPRECWLSGGLVSVAVLSGAHLDAKRTTLSGSEIIGVEVRGAGARLCMAENCRVEDMGTAFRGGSASTKGYCCLLYTSPSPRD